MSFESGEKKKQRASESIFLFFAFSLMHIKSQEEKKNNPDDVVAVVFKILQVFEILLDTNLSNKTFQASERKSSLLLLVLLWLLVLLLLLLLLLLL